MLRLSDESTIWFHESIPLKTTKSEIESIFFISSVAYYVSFWIFSYHEHPSQELCSDTYEHRTSSQRIPITLARKFCELVTNSDEGSLYARTGYMSVKNKRELGSEQQPMADRFWLPDASEFETQVFVIGCTPQC
jgi:hypothetical protein